MPSSRPDRTASARSTLHRSLEPIANSLWILFAIWTVIVAVVWIGGWGGGLAGGEPVPHAELKAAFEFVFKLLDAVWILLAGANVYLSLAATDGLAGARRWAGMILVAALIVGVLSRLTQLPLGPITFPSRLGVQIFGVPFGYPLLWLVIVVGGRDVLARFLPRASHLQIALLTGLLAAGSAWMMEPVAREDRAWWLWREGRTVIAAPLRNFLTWGVLSSVLAYFNQARLVPLPSSERWKIPATWAAVHAVFLLRHAVRVLT